MDPSLCEAAKRHPNMQQRQSLAEKHGIDRRGLKSSADSGLVPKSRIGTVKRGPVLMSAAAFEPLILEMKTEISGTLAGPKIGVHQMHLDEKAEASRTDRGAR